MPVSAALGMLRQENHKLKTHLDRVPVAHTSNPSYLKGRDQEAHSSKPAWANSL
jgi:hypothetical protein